MKIFFGGLLTFLVIIFSVIVYSNIKCNYEIENNYSNHWNLADKSSTIEAKQKHISNFVNALEEGNKLQKFAAHNAIFLKTPNNSFRSNMDALYTLNQRLNEIKEMNPSSFEYNTAIQQITAQEQGEAAAMISVLNGCYKLSEYPICWAWIGASLVLVISLLGATCFFVLFEDLM